MRGSPRFLCLFIVSILLLFAGVAQAAVVLYVGGGTTTPCPGATGAALGDVTVSVSAGGVIADGTYLTITINPGILSARRSRAPAPWLPRAS